MFSSQVERTSLVAIILSEVTPLVLFRHYGLQAKAGNVSGGNNSQIDDIVGRLTTHLVMPYLVVTSSEQRYIDIYSCYK